MNITVTITLSPAVQALLETLVGNLSGGAPVKPITAASNGAATNGKKIDKPVEKVETNAAETDTETHQPVKKSEERLTVEAVRAVVAQKSATHKTEIKAILTAHGAKNVTELEAEHYQAVIDKVKAL